jgi:calcineurin-like phosphoesterase family protein
MKTFLISDTHFGHEGICHFTNYDGSKVRPFDNAAEMDQFMISAWNDVVGENDKVYHLGDVAMSKKHLGVMKQLKGRKVLIKGNHDTCKIRDYTDHFYDIRSCHVLNGMILTHIPISGDCLLRFGCNIHGHVHGNSLADPQYFNMCVEKHNFAPVEFGAVENMIIENGGKIGFKTKGNT